MAKKTKVRRVMTANDKATLLTALAYIVLGALLLIGGINHDALKWMMFAAGILLVAGGCYELIKKSYYVGIAFVVVGILFMLGLVGAIINIMIIVIGVIIAVKGVIELFYAFKGSHVVVASIIGSILSIVAGVFLVVAGSAVLDWALIVVGILMLLDGILIFFGKKLI